MQLIDMSDYNRGARTYWWLTTLVGALTVGVAMIGVARMDQVRLLEVIALMVVVYLTGLRPIRVPGTQAIITPGDIFIFLSALVLGAPAAILVAVTDAFSASCRISQRWTSRLGGPALMAIATFLSASFFERELRWLHEYGWFSSGALLGALLLFALVHFLLNTFLMAFHQALKRCVSPVALWWANYSWVSVTCTSLTSPPGRLR